MIYLHPFTEIKDDTFDYWLTVADAQRDYDLLDWFTREWSTKLYKVGGIQLAYKYPEGGYIYKTLKLAKLFPYASIFKGRLFFNPETIVQGHNDKSLDIQFKALPVAEYYDNIKTNIVPKNEYNCLSFEQLTPIQYDIIHNAIQVQEGVIGAEVGSGKTMMALILGREITDREGGKILIVVLKSIVHQWKEEVANENLTDRVDVIHWEAFRTIIKFGEDKNGRKSRRSATINEKHKYKDVMNTAISGGYKVVIYDEAHKVKNSTSDLSVVVRTFLTKIANIPYRYALTGTPITKTSSDIHGILKTITTHPISSFNKFQIEKLRSKIGGENLIKNATVSSIWYKPFKAYEINTYEDIVKILESPFFQNKIFSKYNIKKSNYLMLTEKQRAYILNEIRQYKVTLPTVNRKLHPLVPTENYKKEYYDILQQAKEVMTEHGRINTAMQKLYVLSTKYKLGWTLDYIKQHKDKKIVVMASFTTEFIYPLSKELDRLGIGNRVFTGDLSVSQKVQNKKDFMEDENVKVILISYAAGSTGLDGLQKVSNTLVLANPVWLLSDMIQAIARVRRPFGKYNEMDLVIPHIISSLGNPSLDEAMLNACNATREVFNDYLTKGEELDEDMSAILNSSQRKMYAELSKLL